MRSALPVLSYTRPIWHACRTSKMTLSGHKALDYHVLMDKFTTLAEFDGSVVESSGSCFKPNMVQFKT
jgi:hypothetical protein